MKFFCLFFEKDLYFTDKYLLCPKPFLECLQRKFDGLIFYKIYFINFFPWLENVDYQSSNAKVRIMKNNFAKKILDLILK